MIDTHIHLYSEQYEDQWQELIKEAVESGIEKMYMPSIDQGYFSAMMRVKEAFPSHTEAMIGLHPTHVNEKVEKELDFVESQLKSTDWFAIGEIGLDYYWDTTFAEEQKMAFRRQLNWAKELNKCVSIHVRNSEEDFLKILEEEQNGNLRAVWHCFSGNEEQGKKAIDLGLSLGLGGVLTFKNGNIDQFIHRFPIEKLLLETDGPYLTPTPYRGKLNKPIYLHLVAEKLATLFHLTVEEIDQITTQNAKVIYEG